MRFEKWQALGNDYVIVEEPIEQELVRRDLRPPHRRRRRRRARARTLAEAGLRRAAADLQPRRLGGRAVGQRRPRGDHVPASPRLDRRAPVLDRDDRRRDPADDPRRADVPRRHGSRRPRRRRSWSRGRRGQELRIGNPQFAIHVADPRRARGARPRRRGAADRDRCALPGPHERLVLDAARARRDPRADLRARRRRDAQLGHRRDRRRGRPRAARRRLPGDGASSTAASSSSTSARICTSTSPAGRCPSSRGEWSSVLTPSRASFRARPADDRPRLGRASSTPGIPAPVLGDQPRRGRRPQRGNEDALRGVGIEPVTTVIADLAAPPADVADAYLRLHLLSHRLVPPARASTSTASSACCRNVAWTSLGPVAVDRLADVRLRVRAARRPSRRLRRRQVPAHDRLRRAVRRAHRRRRPRPPRRAPRRGHDGDARGLLQLQRRHARSLDGRRPDQRRRRHRRRHRRRRLGLDHGHAVGRRHRRDLARRPRSRAATARPSRATPATAS